MAQRRRLLAGLIVAVAVLAVAAVTDAATSRVSLRLPAASLHAGQQVEARLVNHSDATLEVAMCPVLARHVDGRWVTVTHSHGVNVTCGTDDPVGGSAGPHSTQTVNVELYDDLAPGSYRVTVPYRDLGKSTIEPPFSTTGTAGAAVTFRVLAYDPGAEPHLSDSRLDAIALKAAKVQGDGSPTLVRGAEGSRFLANLVASGGGDLVYAWNPSYLIAMRGSFRTPAIPTPTGIPMGPGPVRIAYSVLDLIVDARTGAVTDSDSRDTYPDLARLGRVSTERR